MLALLWSGFAFADCSLTEDLLFQASTASDVSAPRAGEVLSWTITRGRKPAASGTTADSCEEIGIIEVAMQRPADDTDTDDTVGYLPVIREGDTPDGMVLPDTPLSGPNVRILWNDGAVNQQDAIEFTLNLIAVDTAGNVGGSSEDIEIFDDGVGAACDVAGGTSVGWLAAGVLLFGLRRRQR
ncbi:MAG: hypothetical protein H6738_15475 [Alphaproteobacteria bacterium]|nr:hypothetical protein [Alphaproteobacteria bacterium]MCB9698178.1 hypothetical protein [Alphaproteobacteria bacterium]